MLSLMDKEIAAYSDEEMAELIKDKSFTTTTKQHAVWFLKYIYNKEPEKFHFNNGNALSIANAQKIINNVELSAEQYHTQKTGAKKHFNIPQTALIPTATALIICEQWRRKQAGDMCDILVM